MRQKAARISYKFYTEVKSCFKVKKGRIIRFSFILKKILSLGSAYIFRVNALKAQFYLLFKINPTFRKGRQRLGIRERIRITWPTKLQG